MTTDTNGRPWARVDQVIAGTLIEPDSGFDCLAPHMSVIVERNAKGELCIPCRCGRHMLDGQLDFDGGNFYVGIYLA